jgi:F0F1-type ATP synthase membrane subunit b/b'
MEDHEILRHLLDLEREASGMVDDAQAEADRKLSAGEKQNRARHDEIYAREVQALEAALSKNLDIVKEDYRKQLDAYRESLKTMHIDTKAFSSLAEKLLIPSFASGREP